MVQPATYRIKNVKSGTYIDKSTDGSQTVHGWQGYDGNLENQRWHVRKVAGPGEGPYVFENAKYLDFLHVDERQQAEVSAKKEGIQATHFDIIPKDNGHFAIHYRGSNLAVDLNNGSSKDGEKLHLWNDNGVQQQRWEFIKVGDHQLGEFRGQ